MNLFGIKRLKLIQHIGYEENNYTHLITVTCAVLMTGCTTGTHIVTGIKRPVIKPEQVTLYQVPPPKFEIVGIVNSQSPGKSQAKWIRLWGGIKKDKRQKLAQTESSSARSIPEVSLLVLEAEAALVAVAHPFFGTGSFIFVNWHPIVRPSDLRFTNDNKRAIPMKIEILLICSAAILCGCNSLSSNPYNGSNPPASAYDSGNVSVSSPSTSFSRQNN